MIAAVPGPGGFRPAGGPPPHASVQHGRADEAAIVESEEQPLEHAGTEGGQRGVLRNLRSGHFRGVADVRLRINFAEELQAIELRTATAAESESGASFTGGATTAVATFAEGAALTQDQTAAFADAAAAFEAALTEAAEAGLSPRPLADETRAALDAFAGALQKIFAAEEPIDLPEPVEPVETDGTAGTDGSDVTEPTAPDYAALLDELDALYASTFETLTSVPAYAGLPPLSEPSGNGVAYDRFLAEYRAIFEATSEPATVDPVTADPPGDPIGDPIDDAVGDPTGNTPSGAALDVAA